MPGVAGPARGRHRVPRPARRRAVRRLVLLECKLWRNLQARRGVVAQILEYAALIRGWILGDSGLALAASIRGAVPFEGIVSVKRPRANFADADAHLLWLADAANRSVTMVRPVLRPFAQAGG